MTAGGTSDAGIRKERTWAANPGVMYVRGDMGDPERVWDHEVLVYRGGV